MYTVEIANESTSAITVKGFWRSKIEKQELIYPQKSGFKCQYVDLSFVSYYISICKVDSITIEFENGKGYFSWNEYDQSKEKSIKPSIFTPNPNNFRKVGKNHYQYVITEEHYKNAHVLP